MKTDYGRNKIYYKVVYWGAGLCGKTTNLQALEKIIPATHRSELITFDTQGERTLFFDNMDFNIGKKGKYDIRVRLYTVPGQSHYAATRREVLRDVDAIVFVADSQPEVFDSNLQSLKELVDYLEEHNLDLKDMPFVLQLNKRDIPGVVPVSELVQALNINKSRYIVEAVATTGAGIHETLRQMITQIVQKIQKTEIKGGS